MSTALIFVSSASVYFCQWHSFLDSLHVWLSILVSLKQQVERCMIFFSLVEKQRTYYQQEETPEMMAARIDRDVVSETVIIRPLALSFFREKMLTGKVKFI